MASEKIIAIVDSVAALSVLELAELVKEVEDRFDAAWLHHQHNNPHHWQHWLLREDDGGTKALEMDHLYVVEMVCDHWAFSWVKGDLYEILCCNWTGPLW